MEKLPYIHEINTLWRSISIHRWKTVLLLQQCSAQACGYNKFTHDTLLACWGLLGERDGVLLQLSLFHLELPAWGGLLERPIENPQNSALFIMDHNIKGRELSNLLGNVHR
jgi:hypothetical protein